MPEVIKKPSLKNIRAEYHRLGLSPETTGAPTDEFIRQARQQDDPLAWMSLYGGPAGPAAEPPAGQNEAEAETPAAAAANAPQPAEAACEVAADEAPAEVAALLPPATVEVPLADVDFSRRYVSRRADVHLSPAQAKTLRRICYALDWSNETLNNGRRVYTPADAIRWLLEKIGVD